MNENIKIVIAEDSPTQAAQLQFILEDNGYTVLHGKNGLEALKIIQNEKPDLVISDIIMPEMDGFELTKHIKNNPQLKDIPIILVTALSSLKDILKGLEYGAENYIIKPYEEEDLISKVEVVLKNGNSGIAKLRDDKLVVTVEDSSYSIDSKSTKIIDFLITTYENVLNKNKIVEKTQNELRILNESLEEKVLERTAELQKEISERKQFQVALEISELRLRQITEHSQEWIWEVDSKGLYTYSSSVVETTLGYKSDEIIKKKHFYDFFHPEDKEDVKNMALEAFKLKQPFSEFINRTVSKNGDIVWLSSSGVPILDAKGNLLGYRGADLNITKRKLAEEALQESEDNLRQLSLELQERNSDLESYAHTVAHDLKNPVASILGFAELIYTEDLSMQQIKDYSKYIFKSSSNLSNIISELLLFASLQKTEIDSVELNMKEIVSAAIEYTIPENEQSNVTIILPDKWLISNGYAAWIEEVWKNFISNAVKYGGSPAKMEFGCEPISIEKGEVFIKYWIKDFGPGISEKNQKRLFNKFERLDQVNATGHGLGLSIVRRIVDKLGGTTGVESELGKGSTFYFTLPSNHIIKKTKAKDEVLIPLHKNQFLIQKLLIVEDDIASSIYFGEIAKTFSKEVILASDGLEAVKICRENPDIDLVLMDIGLPVINGLDATKKIKEFNKDVPIIAQTAFTMSNNRDKAIEAGCNNFISKPINVAELIEMIDEQLNKSKTNE